jgi:hypothetical protein
VLESSLWPAVDAIEHIRAVTITASNGDLSITSLLGSAPLFGVERLNVRNGGVAPRIRRHLPQRMVAPRRLISVSPIWRTGERNNSDLRPTWRPVGFED